MQQLGRSQIAVGEKARVISRVRLKPRQSMIPALPTRMEFLLLQESCYRYVGWIAALLSPDNGLISMRPTQSRGGREQDPYTTNQGCGDGKSNELIAASMEQAVAMPG